MKFYKWLYTRKTCTVIYTSYIYVHTVKNTNIEITVILQYAYKNRYRISRWRAASEGDIKPIWNRMTSDAPKSLMFMVDPRLTLQPQPNRFVDANQKHVNGYGHVDPCVWKKIQDFFWYSTIF